MLHPVIAALVGFWQGVKLFFGQRHEPRLLEKCDFKFTLILRCQIITNDRFCDVTTDVFGTLLTLSLDGCQMTNVTAKMKKGQEFYNRTCQSLAAISRRIKQEILLVGVG